MLTGILLFLLILVLLLAVPLTLTFHLVWNRGLSGHVRLGWGNGWLHTDIPIQPGDGDKKKGRRKRKQNKKRSKPSAIRGKALLHNKPFRERVVRFLRETWAAIEKHNLKLFVRVGLDDPADTGILWSVLGPLSAILASSRNSEVRLQPDFLDPAFELDSSGRVRIVPLRLVYLTAGLLLSPTIWSGLYRARNG